MSVREKRREAAIDRMADHLLREGMAGASLRPLAVAAGTSDRMLMYYFTNRDDLLAATLERVASRLAGLLDAALPSEPPRAAAALLGEVWAAMKSPTLQPFMHLWLELAAAAAREQQPHRVIAGHIADGFLQWIARRLPGADGERLQIAGLMLGSLEGVLLLDAIGRRPLADSAALDLAELWSARSVSIP